MKSAPRRSVIGVAAIKKWRQMDQMRWGGMLMRNPYSAKRKAISLTELVVVLAILLVLAAVLTPVVGKVRQRATIAVCASNLRQIGQAVGAYRTQNKGRFPRVNLMPAPFDNPRMPGAALYDGLRGYLPVNSPVYRCPGDAGIVFDRCAAASPRNLGLSYNFAVFPEHSYAGTLLMWDYSGDSLHGLVQPFHPAGTNSLYWDGSVVFRAAGESRWPKP